MTRSYLQDINLFLCLLGNRNWPHMPRSHRRLAQSTPRDTCIARQGCSQEWIQRIQMCNHRLRQFYNRCPIRTDDRALQRFLQIPVGRRSLRCECWRPRWLHSPDRRCWLIHCNASRLGSRGKCHRSPQRTRNHRRRTRSKHSVVEKTSFEDIEDMQQQRRYRCRCLGYIYRIQMSLARSYTFQGCMRSNSLRSDLRTQDYRRTR